MMDRPLTREKLGPFKTRVIQSGSHARPELALFEMGDAKIAVKDCRCMQRLLRFFVGRRNQRWEVKVYRRLEGVRGIPSLLGVLDRDAFAVQFVEGETLNRSLGKAKIEMALRDLGRVVGAIHARRVVHLDLKQKRNILVGLDGAVWVIDFQSAICCGSGPLGRILFAVLKGRDLGGLVKFKAKYLPDLLTPQELSRYKRERIFSKLWPFNYLMRGFRRFFRSEKGS